VNQLLRSLTLLGVMLAVLYAAPPASARTSNSGGWVMLYGSGSFAPVQEDLSGLLWWFDTQLRMRDDSDGYDQLLIRPGLGADLGRGFSAWLGYLYVNEDPDGRSNFDEHRVWQQLLWKGSLASFNVQSRTRLEQRFVDGDGEAGWRFREFVKASYAFPSASRFGLAVYDEVFFDLNDTSEGADTGFAQNRFFIGPTMKLGDDRQATLELGYLNQFIRRDGGSDSVNHLVSLNLLFSLP
jgi:Protein of unknown function (DUF2490)